MEADLNFTAKEAKKLAKDYYELVAEKSKAEFLSVITDIKKEAEDGGTTLSYYKSISEAVQQQLESRGFKVDTYYDQRDGNYSSISWN